VLRFGSEFAQCLWALVEVLRDAKGRPQPDPDLRGQETIPLPDTYQPDDSTIDILTDGVDDHLKTEVLPHAPDAWADHTKTKLGYEIPFTRIFYRYQPPRPLHEIDADIKQVETEILQLLAEVTEWAVKSPSKGSGRLRLSAT
jgi:type I restriction enzyme M protein